MMTSKVIMLFFCFISSHFFSQKIIEDFNNDTIKDTLTYKCYRVDASKNINEPICKCKITLGVKKKEYDFILPYVSDITISSCGAGCISVYDASKDTELIEEYFYNKKYDDWILRNKELNEKYRNKTKNKPKKYLISISSRKFNK